MDRQGQEKAFSDLPEDAEFIPIISLSENQTALINFGQVHYLFCRNKIYNLYQILEVLIFVVNNPQTSLLPFF